MPRYYRRVIRICAEDSPNVRLGLAQRARGEEPTGEELVPGVLSLAEYDRRRATWDANRQCVGLDARFWEGQDLYLFPKAWLDRSFALWTLLQRQAHRRQPLAVGVDTAEGGDSTGYASCDHLGIVRLESHKTPDTNVIPAEILTFCRDAGVSAAKVMLDRGGGGKQAADRLRSMGFPCKTVAFGGNPELEIKRGLYQIETRKDVAEDRYAYLNRRCELYDVLSGLMDPGNPDRQNLYGDGLGGFSLPPYKDLRKQLSVIKKMYDAEGRMFIQPKSRKAGQDETKQKTLTELIGHSPDEADAIVLAVWGMVSKGTTTKAGATI